MPWRWTPYIDGKVRDAVALELMGSEARLEASGGESLATLGLTGKLETVVALGQNKGRAVRLSIRNPAGELLGSIPASEVCDRTEVEPGARVTLNLRLG